MKARALFVITMAALAVHGCGGDDTSSDAGDAMLPTAVGGTGAASGGTVAPPPTGGAGGMTSTTPVDAGGTDAGDTTVDAATDAATDSGSDASTGDDGGNDPCGDGVLDDGEACDPGLSKCCKRDCSGPHASGQICRRRAGDCDLNERCDGTSLDCPADEVVDSGTTCRAAEGECDVAEECDGVAPTCPSDEFVTALTPCGDTLTDTECDKPDTCDGDGVCDPRHLTSAVTCADGDLTDCLAARCDGGACVQNFGTVAENTPCGDTATNTECDKPDTCDVSGTCRSRYVSAGVQCADTNTDDCDDAECDGGGLCIQDHDSEAAGTPCLDTSTDDCDDARCDAAGACVQDYAVEAVLTPCGDPTPIAGGCDAADSCDAVGNCDPRNVSIGTQCNDSNVDDCDDAQCDGDGSCVQDQGFEADAYPCDLSSGTCWAGLCCRAETVDPDHDGACDLENVEDDLVFVTSASSTGGSFGGLAGADAFCNDQAQAANLAGSYVAWLSSSTTDAVNRVADGPFVRVDGVVVANDVADLIDATLDNAISKTELGDTSTVPVWTGTAPDGTGIASGDFCGDWTNTGLDGLSGTSGAVDATWTEAAAPLCSASQSLYCFQLDCPGVVNVDFANDPDNCGGCGNVCPSGYCLNGTCAGIVFVTSVGYPGNLLGGSGGGGVADGDLICAMHASDGGFAGTFTAWLSGYDPGAGGVVHAKDRIDDQPYVLPDGTVIAPNGLADLTSASLLGPIDHDEIAPGRVAYVWTGTAPNGTAASPRCSEWTSNAIAEPGVGGYTTSGASDPYWTDRAGAPFPFSPYPCSQTHTIYCFQDLP